MKVIITNERIKILTTKKDMPVDYKNAIDWSCRLAALEAMAWAVQQLSNEMQKSLEYYRTGKIENQKASID